MIYHFCSTFINCQVMSESSILLFFLYIFSQTNALKRKLCMPWLLFNQHSSPSHTTHTHTLSVCHSHSIPFPYSCLIPIPRPQCHFDFNFNVKCFSLQILNSLEEKRVKKITFSKDYFQLIKINEVWQQCERHVRCVKYKLCFVLIELQQMIA